MHGPGWSSRAPPGRCLVLRCACIILPILRACCLNFSSRIALRHSGHSCKNRAAHSSRASRSPQWNRCSDNGSASRAISSSASDSCGRVRRGGSKLIMVMAVDLLQCYEGFFFSYRFQKLSIDSGLVFSPSLPLGWGRISCPRRGGGRLLARLRFLCPLHALGFLLGDFC